MGVHVRKPVDHLITTSARRTCRTQATNTFPSFANHETKPCVNTIYQLHEHIPVQDNPALYHLHLAEQLLLLQPHFNTPWQDAAIAGSVVQFGVQ
jgi:hypothetical protein